MAIAMGRMQPPDDDNKITSSVQGLVLDHLSGFSVRQLCDLLWGLGKAGCRVDREWLDKVWKKVTSSATQVGML